MAEISEAAGGADDSDKALGDAFDAARHMAPGHHRHELENALENIWHGRHVRTSLLSAFTESRYVPDGYYRQELVTALVRIRQHLPHAGHDI